MATLKIKQIVREKGITMAKLAEEMGIHPVNLSSSLNGNPTLSTLNKIAEVLGVEVADLFEKENKTSVNGFVKVNDTVYEVSSVADLENVYNRVMHKNYTSSYNVKALILDFDHTIFNTDADSEVRKLSKVKDWDLIFSKIPEYKLYDGWREVFSEAKAKGIKIAIVSTAKKDLIQRTLKHFQLDCDVIIGWRRKPQKPDPKLIEIALDKLKVNKDEVISIGDSVDDKQMSDNGGVRFIGAIWDCEHEESIQELKQGKVLNTPRDLLNYI